MYCVSTAALGDAVHVANARLEYGRTLTNPIACLRGDFDGDGYFSARGMHVLHALHALHALHVLHALHARAACEMRTSQLRVDPCPNPAGVQH